LSAEVKELMRKLEYSRRTDEGKDENEEPTCAKVSVEASQTSTNMYP
jgi:hypothetical protein